jgi:ferredoxin
VKAWRVEVRNRGVTYEAPEGRTFLESAEDGGVRLPFGCRYGACLNCAARLVEGHVSMQPGTALRPEHLEARVFLVCCAEPRSDCVIEVGGAMGVLPVSPWAGGG